MCRRVPGHLGHRSIHHLPSVQDIMKCLKQTAGYVLWSTTSASEAALMGKDNINLRSVILVRIVSPGKHNNATH